MSQPIKEQKRVVSKAEYLRYRSRKAALALSGFVLYLLGLLGAIVGWFAAFGIVLSGSFVGHFWLLVSCLVVGLSLLVVRSGLRMMDRADCLESVVLLTLHAAAQLSLEESLMRASSEPPVPQEEVLLRAASSNQETPQEQLLRAVSQEEQAS